VALARVHIYVVVSPLWFSLRAHAGAAEFRERRRR
jgi:hypothetical protein